MPDRLAASLSRLDLAAEPDAALLDRFAAAPDDAPFAELVRRHGPMVLGVCRRIVGPADADDAFQAAFLVLARKAATVRGRPVGGWLCRVAGNVARRHRDQLRRRVRHEHAAARSPVARAASDLAVVIDDELARLPDAERAAVTACLLEGRTQEVAARELGWSFSTLRRRLDRGKELLRDRLTRRGVGVPAGFVGVVLVEPVPPALADLTRVGAVGFARGVKTATPAVSLAEGVLSMTLRTKLAVMAGLVAAVGLTVGTGVALQPPPAGTAGTAPAAPPPKAGAKLGDDWRVTVPPLGPRRIKAGDVLRIEALQAFETAPINGPYTVETTGTVALGPAYGRVDVKDATAVEAEAKIALHLKTVLRNPTVMVTFADPPADAAVAARLAGLEARVRALEDEVARLKAARRE